MDGWPDQWTVKIVATARETKTLNSIVSLGLTRKDNKNNSNKNNNNDDNDDNHKHHHHHYNNKKKRTTTATTSVLTANKTRISSISS